MDVLSLAVAAIVGAGTGYAAPLAADAVATPRYGAGAEGHDPEDLELAPLRAPSTQRQRTVCAVLGTLAAAAVVDRLGAWEVRALFGVVGWLVLVACVVDLQYLRLPNALTYPAAVAAIGLSALASARLDAPFEGAVVGALAYPGVLLFAALALAAVGRKNTLGGGDPKLAISLGASIGWLGGVFTEPSWAGAAQFIIVAAMIGNVLGAVVGIVALRALDKPFPFGPYLAIGWFATILLWEQLAVT